MMENRSNLLLGFIFMSVIFTSTEVVYAEQPKSYNLSGRIENLFQGDIYIFLVDEETSKKPFQGVMERLIPQEELTDLEYLNFVFHSLPEGEYGIRCYQDQNSNGKLDRGIFGFKEPWGLSWNDTQKSGWPSFDNFKFILNRDIDNIRIIMDGGK